MDKGLQKGCKRVRRSCRKESFRSFGVARPSNHYFVLPSNKEMEGDVQVLPADKTGSCDLQSACTPKFFLIFAHAISNQQESYDLAILVLGPILDPHVDEEVTIE